MKAVIGMCLIVLLGGCAVYPVGPVVYHDRNVRAVITVPPIYIEPAPIYYERDIARERFYIERGYWPHRDRHYHEDEVYCNRSRTVCERRTR